MHHIIKAVYEYYTEQKKKKRTRGNVTFDAVTQTITIEGGDVTVLELYQQWKEEYENS